MNRSRVLLTATIMAAVVSFLMAVPVQVLAADMPGGTPTVNSTTGANRMATARVNADKEIDRRVTVLNNLIAKLGVLMKVSASQKASLTTQVQTEIANLTALKAKIDADTDMVTLKADKQSIVSSYRVFLLFVPQVTITIHADQVLTVSGAFQTLADKLQARINTAAAAGKDVTAASSSLADMKAKISDATTQANNAVAAVAGLTPVGYPGNKVTLTSARSMLAAARTDLKAARQDVNGVRTGLKGK